MCARKVPACLTPLVFAQKTTKGLTIRRVMSRGSERLSVLSFTALRKLGVFFWRLVTDGKGREMVMREGFWAMEGNGMGRSLNGWLRGVVEL